jgi:hypothetical protein
MLIPLVRLLRVILTWTARLVWLVLLPARWLLSKVPGAAWAKGSWARLTGFFRARFQGTKEDELWGYAVWGAMGLAVGIPEITAAIKGRNFIFPTISTTIGHLEDFWPIVALAPVAIIVVGAYSMLVIRPDDKSEALLGKTPAPTKTGAPEVYTAISRDKYGRLTKRDLDPAAVPDDPAAAAAPTPTRPLLPVDPYFTAVTIGIIVATVVAARSHDRWLTAYVLYSLIGVFWIVVPAGAAFWLKRDVPFPTLFLTIRQLELRLHFVAYVIAAGLAVLVVHLAIYPWPDLSRSSSKYGGVTPGRAQERAESAVAKLRVGHDGLEVTTKARAVINEREAWVIYFGTKAGAVTGCSVVITGEDTWTSVDRCKAAP